MRKERNLRLFIFACNQWDLLSTMTYVARSMKQHSKPFPDPSDRHHRELSLHAFCTTSDTDDRGPFLINAELCVEFIVSTENVLLHHRDLRSRLRNRGSNVTSTLEMPQNEKACNYPQPFFWHHSGVSDFCHFLRRECMWSQEIISVRYRPTAEVRGGGGGWAVF